jgi:hypothetical protein
MRIKTQHAITKPLDGILLPAGGSGRISVRDGEGHEYASAPADKDFELIVGGALGSHTVFHLDDEGRIIDSASFRVDCETEIEDEGGRFKRLLETLLDTMLSWWSGADGTKYLRIGGKRYRFFVCWLRDHVHALKGMKYFDADLKSGMELYADSQREDGMIWDKCKQFPRNDIESYNNVQWRREEFSYGDFWQEIPGHPTRAWQRIPVENDVEFLFIEGIYNTWKACGDDTWMAGLLDNAIRAVAYSTSDPYRWSEKFQLLKRGYTIDTWDFQSGDDARRSGSSMRVLLDKTEFNIFHGDNVGMSVCCLYLAEMLRVAGREAEAATFDALGRALKSRLDKLSWNGDFYTHMVPENPDAERDLGATPTDQQVTLSNAYALNRRIEHSQCAAIIRSYQRIRREMPESAPAEWYNCFPVFEKGYQSSWDYMNGGVSTICAGELARGAFNNGFESYGVDILDRIIALAKTHGGYLHNTFKGKLPEPPPTTDFTPLALPDNTCLDIRADAPEGLGLSSLPVGQHRLVGIEFDVTGSALRLDQRCPQTEIPVAAATRAIYLLHVSDISAHKSTADRLIGWFTAEYADGTHATQYIQTTRQLEGAKYPAPETLYGAPTRNGAYRLGWHDKATDGRDTGLFVYGWNNTCPDKVITKLRFIVAETNQTWWVAGITLSDQPVHFPVSPIGSGIPDLWGAGAVVYAMIEGLAGIVDAGRAFDRVCLSPRWAAAGVNTASACARYPASGGYVRYRYTLRPDAGAITLLVTGNASMMNIELLLPPDSDAAGVTINGLKAAFHIKIIESSKYACFDLSGIRTHEIKLALITKV